MSNSKETAVKPPSSIEFLAEFDIFILFRQKYGVKRLENSNSARNRKKC